MTQILPSDVLQLDTPLLELSVVLPCLNEAGTLGVCVGKAQRALLEHKIRGEVIVADNGSTDGSDAIAVETGARLIRVEQRGYGSALMGGIRAARGRYVIIGDSDDTYDFGQILVLLQKLREGFDLVIGNRFKGGIQHRAMPVLHRYLGTPVLTWIARRFFRCPVGDINCGLRGFRRQALLQLGMRTTGMEFATETLVKASLFGLRIAEVPTTLSPDGRGRQPHLRTWRDGWRHLRFMLLYSPRWLFLYPGGLLTLVGLVVLLWLLAGPRTVGRVTFDVHTMLYAAVAVPLGFQLVAFALFTKVFAITEGLLPKDAGLDRVFRTITLEVGLIVGGLFVVGGVAGSAYALEAWGSRGFGPLDYAVTMRVVIPSAAAMTLGFQIVFSSFFLSILGLGRQ